MSGAYVVVRRSGSLWGLPAAAVAAVERRAGSLRLRLADGGELETETVVALADTLEIRRLPSAARSRLPSGVEGLALYAGEPLCVLGEAAGGRRG